VINYLLSFFPSRLPVTQAEFDAWLDSVMALRPEGIPDNRAIRFAAASMMLHVEQGKSWLSKRYFVRKLHRAGANEIAYAFMEKCKADEKADNAAKQAEQTTDEYKAKVEAKADRESPKHLAVVPNDKK